MAREYKDSGIEWIGQIPKEWEVMRMKFIGEFQNGLTYRPTDVCGSEGILVLRSSNIQESKLDFNDNIYVNDCPSELMVNLGDIIICSRNGSADLVGKCAVVDKDIHASFGAFMVRFRSQIRNKYAFYLVSIVIPQYKQFFTTTTINQLTKAMLSSMTGILPPQVEQQKIANYLDKVCGEVDEMIALQEQMIEELKAYKQSVITEAVTRGLNPNSPMRDSGIDWIGEIPDEWNLISLQSLSESIRNGYVGPTRDLFKDEGVKYIQSLHLKDGTIDFDKHHYFVSEDWANKHPKIFKDDLLIVQTGDIGQVAVVTPEYDACNCHALIIVVLKSELCLPLYVSYYLRSSVGKELLLQCKTGALLPHLNSGKIGVTPITLPSLDEQRAIATYLDTKCSEIDSLIALKQAKIEELKEYKKSVIYEYVTGKKEVV